MKILGIQFAPLNIPLERRLQTLSVILVEALFFSGPILSILFLYILFFTKYYWPIIVYAAYWYGEGDIAEKGGRSSQWVRNWRLWKHSLDYFPMKLVKTVDLDPGKNYLLGVFPHGVFSTGVFGLFGTEAGGFSRLFPGIKPYVATLAMSFRMPLLRDVFLPLGFCSVSKKSLNYLLGSPGTGRATVLVVGGAAEAFYAKPGTNRVYLKNRKGFVRLALTNGSSLVPVYSFGENDLYDQLEHPQGSMLRSAQDYFLRVTGVTPVIFLGRGIFHYSLGPLPRRRPVITVVGKPIHVDKVEDPTTEQVETLHRRFVDSLVSLFEKEKHLYLKKPDEAMLEII